ncbi:RNA-guided endonuclease InsQ/TnpB family protein [Tessaracoccus sp.]
MKRVVRVKLVPDAAQRAALRETLTVCNEAATFAARAAYSMRDRRGRTPGRSRLHDAVYYEIKARFGLSAQPSARVIGKTLAAYAALKSNLQAGNYGGAGSERRSKVEDKPVVFRPDAAQPFDDRCLSWNHANHTVSIWTTAGRLQGVRFVGRGSDLELLAAHRKGESDLQVVDGTWYLIAIVDIPDVGVAEPDGFLGVDLGIVNIATTSNGANWSGGAVTVRRKKNVALRAKLQTKGTKSAKRLLKKRSKKETRFVTDVNHQISRKIVAEAQRTGRGIAIENLTGIRARVRRRKPQRAAVHSWAFAQLGAFLTYKAQGAGVVILGVDPAYTSQECSACGHICRANRPNQASFRCVSCGVSLNADVNAARNIAFRGVFEWAAINLPNAA